MLSDVEMSDVASLRDLIHRVVLTGSESVDPGISPETIKLHYLLPEGGKPKKVGQTTRWEEVRRATAFVVTPA